MFSVDFWMPLLIKIDKIKEDYKLNALQVKELDEMEAEAYSFVHIGNEDKDEYIALNKKVITFKLKLGGLE